MFSHELCLDEFKLLADLNVLLHQPFEEEALQMPESAGLNIVEMGPILASELATSLGTFPLVDAPWDFAFVAISFIPPFCVDGLP